MLIDFRTKPGQILRTTFSTMPELCHVLVFVPATIEEERLSRDLAGATGGSHEDLAAFPVPLLPVGRAQLISFHILLRRFIYLNLSASSALQPSQRHWSHNQLCQPVALSFSHVLATSASATSGTTATTWPCGASTCSTCAASPSTTTSISAADLKDREHFAADFKGVRVHQSSL